MSGKDVAIPPPVIWAQRSGTVILTVCLEDCSDPEVNIQTESVSFRGTGGSDKKFHEVTINLFKEIDVEKSNYVARPRNIEITLKKKESGPYWPHLTKEKIKYHWLKVDFNKWRDEGLSDDEDTNGGDFEEMIKQMGTMGGGGGDEKPNFDDLNETDSDDGDLPDLE